MASPFQRRFGRHWSEPRTHLVSDVFELELEIGGRSPECHGLAALMSMCMCICMVDVHRRSHHIRTNIHNTNRRKPINQHHPIPCLLAILLIRLNVPPRNVDVDEKASF